jgi:putative membrane protein
MQRLVIFLLSVSFAAFCQNAEKSKASHSGTTGDQQFVTKAAQGNMAEVNLGQLATRKAQSDDVKKFGQHMVDDHTKAEQDLEGVASKNNLTLPKDVNAQQKAEQLRLEKLSGPAFDRAYMALMVKDHTKDVAEFRKEANSLAANSDLRDFAKRIYPTLDDHLTNAKAVNDSLTSKAQNRRSPKTPSKSSKSSGESGAQGLLLI